MGATQARDENGCYLKGGHPAIAWLFVTGFDAATFRAKACKCGPPPEECVKDDTVLVRYYAAARRDTAFTLREGNETALSVLMADDWSLHEIATYVRMGRPPTPEVLATARALRTTAGNLRRSGFAAVHTPGAIPNGPHVSVVWPAAKPFEEQAATWPPEVSAAFRACFNEEAGET